MSRIFLQTPAERNWGSSRLTHNLGKSVANVKRVLFGLIRRDHTHLTGLMPESKPALSYHMLLNTARLDVCQIDCVTPVRGTPFGKCHSLHLFAFLRKEIRKGMHLNASDEQLISPAQFVSQFHMLPRVLCHAFLLSHLDLPCFVGVTLMASPNMWHPEFIGIVLTPL